MAIAVALILLAGCGDESPDEAGASDRREMLIFSGAGLRPPVAELADTFAREQGVKVLTDYAGAEVLLSKIKLSRQGDLYIPGDRKYVEEAANQGVVLSQKSVCYFVPTILVQKGNPKNIKGLRDLLQPGLKLGLGNPQYIPIGSKTTKILKKNTIPWSAIENNLKFQSATVNELGIQIQAGALDAVVVWDAVAKYYARHGDEVPIPKEQNIISTVDIGVLKCTRDRALAERFVEFAASERGRAIFQKHHYRVDPPE